MRWPIPTALLQPGEPLLAESSLGLMWCRLCSRSLAGRDGEIVRWRVRRGRGCLPGRRPGRGGLCEQSELRRKATEPPSVSLLGRKLRPVHAPMTGIASLPAREGLEWPGAAIVYRTRPRLDKARSVELRRGRLMRPPRPARDEARLWRGGRSAARRASVVRTDIPAPGRSRNSAVTSVARGTRSPRQWRRGRAHVRG